MSDAKIVEFLSWAKDMGIRTNKVEISTVPGFGLGMRAKETIKVSNRNE